MTTKNIGHCPHGEFSILEGCPKCISETFSPQNNGLTEQVKIVALARQRAQQAATVKTDARVEWEDQNKDLLEWAIQTAQAVTDAESKLRELTLKAYVETGSKAPAPGVSVKIFQTLEYAEAQALTWALDHRMAVKLDAKAFGRIAEASPIDFVTKKEEPRAQIATNLDEYIK